MELARGGCFKVMMAPTAWLHPRPAAMGAARASTGGASLLALQAQPLPTDAVGTAPACLLTQVDMEESCS